MKVLRMASAPPAIPPDGEMPFHMETVTIGSQQLRVGRQAGRVRPGQGRGIPLLLFNGIGGNIEMLAPIARWMPEREIITFDIPGVGHSMMPTLPYRMRHIVRLACGVLDHYGHAQCDALGISWGGAAAQEFAHRAGPRCRRLVLAATATGAFMLPACPSVLMKMATPRRYISKKYARQVTGHIYGGDFRNDPSLGDRIFKHVRFQSRLGYYYQLGAGMGWTSVHWLHQLEQRTLVMAGEDDPLIPLANAKLMDWLIPQSELEVFDCGHLFLLTRAERSAAVIREFLDRA